MRRHLDGYRAGVRGLVDHLLGGPSPPARAGAPPHLPPPVHPTGSGPTLDGGLPSATVAVEAKDDADVDALARRLNLPDLMKVTRIDAGRRTIVGKIPRRRLPQVFEAIRDMSGVQAAREAQGAVVIVKDECLPRIDELIQRLQAAGLLDPALDRTLGAVRGLVLPGQIDAVAAVEGVKSVNYPIRAESPGGEASSPSR